MNFFAMHLRLTFLSRFNSAKGMSPKKQEINMLKLTLTVDGQNFI